MCPSEKSNFYHYFFRIVSFIPPSRWQFVYCANNISPVWDNFKKCGYSHPEICRNWFWRPISKSYCLNRLETSDSNSDSMLRTEGIPKICTKTDHINPRKYHERLFTPRENRTVLCSNWHFWKYWVYLDMDRIVMRPWMISCNAQWSHMTYKKNINRIALF